VAVAMAVGRMMVAVVVAMLWEIIEEDEGLK